MHLPELHLAGLFPQPVEEPHDGLRGEQHGQEEEQVGPVGRGVAEAGRLQQEAVEQRGQDGGQHGEPLAPAVGDEGHRSQVDRQHEGDVPLPRHQPG